MWRHLRNALLLGTGWLTACADATIIAPTPRAVAGAPRRAVSSSDANPIPGANRYGINARRLTGALGSTEDAGYANLPASLTSAGIGWVRVSVNWKDIQDPGAVNSCIAYKTPGARNRDPNTWNWAELDRTRDRARAAGLNVLAVLAYTPQTELPAALQCVGGAEVYAPADLEGWRNFVQAVVARYPEITHWGIWNETNSDGFFRAPSGVSKPRAYADLVNAAAPVIHSAGDYVVGVDVITTNASPSAGVQASDPFIDEVMGYVGANLDVLSLHVYPAPGATSTGAQTVTTIRNISNRLGGTYAAANNVWVTEGALAVWEPSDADQNADVQSFLSALASRQAASWKKLFYWDALIDQPGDRRGIIRGVEQNAFAPKPAYTTYSDFTRLNPGITYRAHVTGNGWLAWQTDGFTAGTTGQSRQLEAIEMRVAQPWGGTGVEYEAYIRGAGWQGYRTGATTAGTVGAAVPMEAMRARLTSAPAGTHVCYRAHIAVYGWQPAVCDGSIAGRPGSGYQMEALEVWTTR